MSHRRTASIVPQEVPVLSPNTGLLGHTWLTFMTTINEYIHVYNKYVMSITPINVPAASTMELIVTVPGVASNDFVYASKGTHTPGIGIGNVRVAAKDTIAITFINTTAADILPPQENYTIKVDKV